MSLNNKSYLLSGLKLSDSFVVKYWKPLVLFRLYVTLIILVYMQDRYIYQIFTLLMFSVIYQALLVNFRPFEENVENYIELFNEVLNSIYLYNLLALTEFCNTQSAEVRNFQGWILLILCLVTVAINICHLLKAKFYQIKLCIRRRRMK